MALREDFSSKAKGDNWTFSLKKSSLGQLIQTLSVKTPNLPAVAKEVAALSDAKRKKYKKSLAFLEKRLPGLKDLVDAHQGGIGLTDQTYLPGKEVRRTDADNR